MTSTIKRILAGGLVMMTQTALALSVVSRGDDVLIRGAVSPGGLTADIRLVETGPAGQTRLVPLKEAVGVQVEVEGPDLRIHNATGGGRYQALSIERNENGNHQRMRIGIGGEATHPRPPGRGAESGQRPPLPGAPPRPVPGQRHDATSVSHWLNEKVANQDYVGRNLAGSSSVNSRFEETRFSRANLAGAQMTNTWFVRSDLRGVNLGGGRLVNVRFDACDLRGANFRDARLVNVKFGDSDLSGAAWVDGRTCLPGSVGFCRLKGAS